MLYTDEQESKMDSDPRNVLGVSSGCSDRWQICRCANFLH